ncbi:hypothetical protein BHE74_00034887 [Ensete ventricosum]|nr:hypothetical protein BHE74_00034887 [Ensete ventricosum]
MVGSVGNGLMDLCHKGKVEPLPKEFDPTDIVEPMPAVDLESLGGDEGSGKNREIVLGRNVHTMCFTIKEPEVDDEVTGEREAYMASVLARYRRSLIERTKHHLGTTVKGAVDDLDMVIQTLEENGFKGRFYIHCDGALFGLMMPFVKRVCSTLDATIMGSRNGHAPIFLWYTLNRKGYRGFQKEVQKCLRNAHYLKDRLKEAGIGVMLNELSSTVVFERPKDEEFVRRWQLACEGNISHVVVMPNVNIDKLDSFLEELFQKRSCWYQEGMMSPPCIAADIGQENCFCVLHKK